MIAPAVLPDGSALRKITFDFAAAGAAGGDECLVFSDTPPASATKALLRFGVTPAGLSANGTFIAGKNPDTTQRHLLNWRDSSNNPAVQIGTDGAVAFGNRTLGTTTPSPSTLPFQVRGLSPLHIDSGGVLFDFFADDSFTTAGYTAGNGLLEGYGILRMRTSQCTFQVEVTGSLAAPQTVTLQAQPGTVVLTGGGLMSVHGAYDPVANPNLGAWIVNPQFQHGNIDTGIITDISAPIIFATGPYHHVTAEAWRIDYLRNWVPSNLAYVQEGAVNAGYVFGYNVGLAAKRVNGFYGVSLDLTGAVTLSGLPSADPHVVGRLWKSGTTLMVSAG